MSFNRINIKSNVDSTGYQKFDLGDNETGDLGLYNAAIGSEPYIPPITEDEEMPEIYDGLTENEILEYGDIPAKRQALRLPCLADYSDPSRYIAYKDREFQAQVEIPKPDWEIYKVKTHEELEEFFNDHIDDEASAITKIFGPFDGFNGRMSTVEFNIDHDKFHFDGIRTLIPFIGAALGTCAVWCKKHMETIHETRPNRLQYYKAMVNIHCVFIKDYNDTVASEASQVPEREYRRFIFDSMCEDDNGNYLMARSPERLFKMVYNTFVTMAFDKLDAENIQNVPFVDSKFIFYSIRTACVTVFQYEPSKVGAYIPAPKFLSTTKCILNPKVDEYCFRYAILVGLIIASNPHDEITQYKGYSQKWVLDQIIELYKVHANFKALPEPNVVFSDKLFDQFCEDNPEIFLTIWVPSDRKEDRIPIHPVYQSKRTSEKQKSIHLLLLTKITEQIMDYFDSLEEGEQEVFVDNHFACIINIDGLFYKASGKHRVHICPVCNIRRRTDTKGLGFCQNHEQAQYRMAITKGYKDINDIKDAVALGKPSFEDVFATLCPKCSNNFESPEKLEEHREECLIRDNNYRIINLPKERQYLQLSGKDRMKLSMLHTFMVADFESVLQPLGEREGNQLFDSEHVPCSYSLVMESDYDELCKFKVMFGKSGEETISDFCKTIIAFSTYVHNFYKTNLPMKNLTREQQEEYDSAETCYICGKQFTPRKGSRKVCDHDHLNGDYLGAACEGCNINRRPDRMYIPLFFHNGKNYDTHLLIKEITKEMYQCKFEGIAQNSQKIMSFKIMRFKNEYQPDGSMTTTRSMCDIKVLDSILFLLSSLSKLTEVQKHKSRWNGSPETEEEMRGYEDVFPITYKWLKYMYRSDPSKSYHDAQDIYNPNVTLALRKNIYPYKWFDDFTKFNLSISSMVQLFEKKQYDMFTDSVTPDFIANFPEKKKTFFEIMQKFHFKTVKEYAKLYVCMDTLQLADILQETRLVYQKVHKLDMFQFYGLPGYTWSAFQLHIDNVQYKPELFKEGEMDMVCFIARAIRGGCSDSMLRYSHVNNPFMEGQYDPNKPNKYLVYLDANNLYGWSMSQDLPYGDFQWEQQYIIDKYNNEPENFLDYFDILGNGLGAYIMCDLEFPPDTHDKFNWYPLAPVSGYVPEEWISEFSRIMHQCAETKHDSKSRLLLQTLTKREKYVVYYKNLKFYLKHGMVVTKIYKILTFREAPLMKSYIALNTLMRNRAESTAEKNQWKNANNSAYGKTFENQLNYSILKFVSGEDEFNKALKDPGFDGYAFMSDNLMLAKMKYTSIDFNKPIYLGATITELAKLHMFEFYYDVLMNHFGEQNIKLCMTDTDSVLVEVICNDIYREISNIQLKYDCPIDTSPLSDEIKQKYNILGVHNKEVGYFKPEADPVAIQEFVGLRPKVYSTREKGSDEPHMRCKGTPKNSMELYVTHDKYKACLFHNYLRENLRQKVGIDMIRSKDHHIFSIKSSKVSLTCNDSKRFILHDNIHSLAYGHCAIPQYIEYYEKGIPLKPGEKFISPILENLEGFDN